MESLEFEVLVPVRVIASKDLNNSTITYKFLNDQEIVEEYRGDVITLGEKIYSRTETFSQGSNDGSNFSFDCEVPEKFFERKIELLKSLKK